MIEHEMKTENPLISVNAARLSKDFSGSSDHFTLNSGNETFRQLAQNRIIQN